MSKRNSSDTQLGLVILIGGAVLTARMKGGEWFSDIILPLLGLVAACYGIRWFWRRIFIGGTHTRTYVSSRHGSTRVTEVYDHRQTTSNRPTTKNCHRCKKTVYRAADGSFTCCGRTWG